METRDDKELRLALSTFFLDLHEAWTKYHQNIAEKLRIYEIQLKNIVGVLEHAKADDEKYAAAKGFVLPTLPDQAALEDKYLKQPSLFFTANRLSQLCQNTVLFSDLFNVNFSTNKATEKIVNNGALAKNVVTESQQLATNSLFLLETYVLRQTDLSLIWWENSFRLLADLNLDDAETAREFFKQLKQYGTAKRPSDDELSAFLSVYQLFKTAFYKTDYKKSQYAEIRRYKKKLANEANAANEAGAVDEDKELA